MTVRCRLIVVAIVSLSCHVCAGADMGVPADFLEKLDAGHPRLMLKDDGLERLKEQYKSDELLQRYWSSVVEQADGFLSAPPLEYKKIGPRLLHVSRECLKRIYALGLAYRWTGDDKYAAKARENLFVVCEFDDWNPSHFLDTAEMSHAVGVGYDWLFGYLDKAAKEKIKSGLVKNGLEPAVSGYRKGAQWSSNDFNWNQVCNCGMLIGALAIAETDPNYANFIIPEAVKLLPNAVSSYAPDGAWPEGPGYWHYATSYTVYGLCALETALGTDFGLSELEGLKETAYFPIYTTGPEGEFFNFADCGATRGRMPCMFWLADRFKNPVFSDVEHAVVGKYSAMAEHVMWYVPKSGENLWPETLDYHFKGPVEVAAFRSEWNDPNALFVGVKAGYNQVNHGHLDLGTFVLDAMGERWAIDLGADDYNLDGYFDKRSDGKRWTYYRTRSVSHSVPILGGKDQKVDAKAMVVKFILNRSDACVILDLTDAYKEFAVQVIRQVRMKDSRRAVCIFDSFDIKESCDVLWAMTTPAEITLGDKNAAELVIGDKKLVARILEPENAGFSVESAEQQPPQNTNKGINRLVVKLPQQNGKVKITVLLSPVWLDDKVVKDIRLEPK